MAFDLNKCVNYISSTKTKTISEIFGEWLKDHDITRIQWIALYFIYTNKKLSQRELSKLMYINDSSVMRLIDRLERDGLVTRVKSQNDRRKFNLILTKAGNNKIVKLLHFGEDFNSVLTAGISQEDLETFQKVQNKMYENVINSKKPCE